MILIEDKLSMTIILLQIKGVKILFQVVKFLIWKVTGIVGGQNATNAFFEQIS